MRFISTLIVLAVALLAAVHLFFYMSVGAVEPCEAAVSRIIQKQRDQGNDIIAKVGETFRQQGKETLRAEGIVACYRAALTGDVPEQLTVRFNLPRLPPS
jgi:hypothetical protein